MINAKLQNFVEQCEELDADEDGYFTRFDKEKFAKLIIMECSRVAKLAVGTNKVCDAIEQNFGIMDHV